MDCCKCPHYKTGYMWNMCEVTKSEYFYEQIDCRLVDDKGMIDNEELEKSGI